MRRLVTVLRASAPLWPIVLFAGPALSTPTPNLPPDAARVTVVARAEPRAVPIGSPFRLVVEITAPTGWDVVIPLLGDRFGEFDVVDFGDEPPKEENGSVRVVRWFALRTYEPGDKTLPAYPIKYRPPDGEEQDTASNEAVVIVESLLPAEPTPVDLRDIAAPQQPPTEWAPILAAAGGVAGLLGMVALAWWLSSRRRAAAIVPEPAPDEVALTALRRLHARRLLEAGRVEEYYVELSAIVRTYVERRFGLHAPEMTSEEFLAAMQRDPRLGGPHRALLGDFLIESDLVKFARHRPGLENGERAYAAAKRFIDESTPALAAPPAREERHAPP